MGDVGFLQSALRAVDIARTRPMYKPLAGWIVDRRKAVSEQSDESLAKRCGAKDHAAFAELVDRYKHKVHWLVRRTAGAGEAEDLTQEVFLRAYQALPGFRGESKFSTWLYKIARNLCLSTLRKQGRHGGEVSFEEAAEEKIQHLLTHPQDRLEEEIEKRDVSRRVHELINRLPEQYRTALTLFYLNQARYEEIAEIMDVPMGTVKTCIRRGRLRLRNLLLEESDLAGLAGTPRDGGLGKEGGRP